MPGSADHMPYLMSPSRPPNRVVRSTISIAQVTLPGPRATGPPAQAAGSRPGAPTVWLQGPLCRFPELPGSVFRAEAAAESEHRPKVPIFLPPVTSARMEKYPPKHLCRGEWPSPEPDRIRPDRLHCQQSGTAWGEGGTLDFPRVSQVWDPKHPSSTLHHPLLQPQEGNFEQGAGK